MGIALLVLLASLGFLPRLGMEFIPTLDEGAIAINVVRLPNASLDGSVVIAQEIERRALRFPEVATVVTKTGRAEEQSVELDRAALARYALNMAEVNELLETGVAVRVVSTFIEGPQRFPITVRLE